MPSHYSLQVAITQLWLLLHISELPSLIARILEPAAYLPFDLLSNMCSYLCVYCFKLSLFEGQALSK